MKINNNYQQMEIEVKRFYLPCDIEYTCPKCNKVTKEDDYISYPNVNKAFDYTCYCEHCDHEWTNKVKIILGLELVEKLEKAKAKREKV